jgi:hypothetical protein
MVKVKLYLKSNLSYKIVKVTELSLKSGQSWIVNISKSDIIKYVEKTTKFVLYLKVTC